LKFHGQDPKESVASKNNAANQTKALKNPALHFLSLFHGNFVYSTKINIRLGGLIDGMARRIWVFCFFGDRLDIQ
jgi:hypothetical protein